ncbi:MAG: ATP-binding protein [Silicimonas sp.]|nr:ATP-binding protein [Silicimonas sp.]
MSSSFWRNRLGKRIVSLMILASALLSVITAAAQLYFAYERDRGRALNTFSIIQNSLLDGLEGALWEFNFSQVEILLDGMMAKSDVAYLNLTTLQNQIWELGEQTSAPLTFREFELKFANPNGDQVLLGTLNVGISLEAVYARLWGQFWTLLLSNFAKTMVASVIMLLIFDRLAARHLRAILEQVGAGWLAGKRPMRLERPPDRAPDELDDLVAALNTAWEATRDAHADLERKLTEISDMNDMLKDAEREQAEFTFAISHDLKSPTNTIRMLAGELRDSLEDSPSEDAEEILDDIDKTTLRMIQLVEGILAYSRTMDETLDVEEVDLNGEISEILRDISGDIVRVEAEVEVAPLPPIRANRMQMRMLMQNLISNGIKFRDPNRKPKVEVTGSHQAEDGTIRISVRDNGIGIAREHFDKIFGLFQRLHTRTAYQGSGIGLAVCQRIVTNHDGRLELDSEEGAGSTFTIVLPNQADSETGAVA